MVKTRNASDWANYADAQLSAAGYRRGAARRAVVDLLAHEGCALTAIEIERRLSDADKRAVSRASVYRVLEQLEAIGVIGRVELGDGLSRFEATHPDGHHHHHLVCDGCGKLVPFSDAGLERTIHRIAKANTFRVAQHDVTLHGTCRDCR